MWKALFFVVFLAHTILIVSAGDDEYDNTKEKPCPCPKNERWDPCPARLCEPQKCSQLGFPIPCPDVKDECDCPGGPGCVCVDELVRDKNGRCIPRRDCPSCGGDPNAVSGCGCDPLCSGIVRPCPRICLPNSCVCRKGYVRDENLKPPRCVLPKDCTPVCGPNEVFDNCANGGCHQGRTCEEWERLNGNTICIDPPLPGCKPGCLCKKGYVRDRNGKCIPVDECPKKCPPHEIYSLCPAWQCPPITCCDLGYDRPCPVEGKKCPVKPGCICAEGRVRNKEGRCVPRKECPSCGGDPNAESGCGMYCVKKCSNYWRKDVACIEICDINGCICREGYVYDENIRRCVKPWQCSPDGHKCRKNEEFVICPPKCPPRVCGIDDRTIFCPRQPKPGDPDCPPAACRCKNGFVRNDKGDCVRPDECPPKKCPKNEHWEKGVCVCNEPLVRNDKGECVEKPHECPKNEHWDPKKRACVCNKPLVRNNKGVCVERPHKCPKNEHWDPEKRACVCNKPLVRNNKGVCVERPHECPKNEHWDPEKRACVCNKPLVRNDKGVCVERPHECPKNEHWDPNKRECVCNKPLVRNNKGVCVERPHECPKNEHWDPRKRACVCNKPLVRNNKGVCVERPHECPKNEHWDPEKRACVCNKPLVRNDKGVCVERPHECPKNEHWDPEKRACVCNKPLVRNDKGVCVERPHKCPKNEHWDPEKRACVCNKPLVRNDKGVCVERPHKCPKNEHWDPCANGGCHGPRRCSEIGEPVKCIDLIEGGCRGACVCDDHLLRNDKNVCVPEDKCPKKCGKNEVWDWCPWDCPPRICGIDDRAVKCKPRPEPGSKECPRPRCRCKDGYYRDPEGRCVRWEDCPKCKGENEVWDPCPKRCPPQTCESLWKKYHCPREPEVEECKGQCRCKEGYYRNLIGQCISKEHCLECKGPHEYWSCGGACDNVCATLSKQNQTNCPIVNIKCNEMCYCEKDYARDKNGICIPIKDCPRCKGKYEYWDPCPPPCLNENCDGRGKAEACAVANVHGKPPCYPRCRCEDNYLRDKNGNCIPEKECEKCD